MTDDKSFTCFTGDEMLMFTLILTHLFSAIPELDTRGHLLISVLKQ